jgi:hypothetical protein
MSDGEQGAAGSPKGKREEKPDQNNGLREEKSSR